MNCQIEKFGRSNFWNGKGDNMGIKLHELKVQSRYFRDIKSGLKTFELRKMDRDYKVGDFLELYEFEGNQFIGCPLVVRITYILSNVPEYGLEDGYGILGIALCD